MQLLGPEKITFLYRLVEKAAQRSYGLNVARLADLPSEIIERAKTKSHELENIILQRRSETKEKGFVSSFYIQNKKTKQNKTKTNNNHKKKKKKKEISQFLSPKTF